MRISLWMGLMMAMSELLAEAVTGDSIRENCAAEDASMNFK